MAPLPSSPIQSLDQLLDVLRRSPPKNDPSTADAAVAYARQHGLPLAHGQIDWTSLPNFGGEPPADTVGVWSWDATRRLVGTCAADLTIEPR